jgi:hypothetical protein
LSKSGKGPNRKGNRGAGQKAHAPFSPPLACKIFIRKLKARPSNKLLTAAARTIRTEQIAGQASGQTLSRTSNTIIAANTANAIHGDGISMDHDFVVIMERSRRTLCTSHHCRGLIDWASRRAGGNKYSDAKPRSDTSQGQRSESGDEQGGFAHVNFLCTRRRCRLV